MCGPHAVFDAVTPSAERIVLEIEDLKAGVHVLDEAADPARPFIVAHGHRVDCKSSLRVPSVAAS